MSVYSQNTRHEQTSTRVADKYQKAYIDDFYNKMDYVNK